MLCRRLLRLQRRTYTTYTPGATLPPHTEWKDIMEVTGYAATRPCIANPETAATIANAFVPSGSRDKIIIEAFPGPGQLTRALLALPKQRISRMIVLEDNEPWLEWLRPLEAQDPRLTILNLSPVPWPTYTELQEKYLADVSVHDWLSGVHPQLQFITHLPMNVIGEQLVSQWLRMIPDRQWLFRYGRVPMSMLMSNWVWQRIYPKEKSTHCKLSVVAEATVDRDPIIPFEATQPYNDHFFPFTSSFGKERRRKVGNPFRVVQLNPLEHQAVKEGMIEKWDYCVRRLFIKKSRPLKDSLSHLGPGGLQALTKILTSPSRAEEDRVDTTIAPRDLTIENWAALVKAFDEWPFAPGELDISVSMLENRKVDLNTFATRA